MSHAGADARRRSVGPGPTPVGSAGTRPAHARHFVALRPDRAAALAAGRLAKALATAHGGRATPAADLHLTLAFVGDWPACETMRIDAALRGLAAPAGGWPPAPLAELGRFARRGRRAICWAGPAGSPAWLIALAEAVRERLAAAGIPFDARPMVPHCTLARDCTADADVLAAFSGMLPIEVARWSLVVGHSVAGTPAGSARYRWREPSAA